MRTLKSLLCFACSLMVFSSCQKEISEDLLTAPNNNNTDSNTTLYKVQTYTEAFTSPGSSFSDTYRLTYDSNDRILSVIDVADSTNKTIYAYPSSAMYTMDIYSAGVRSIHGDFFLNSIPMVDSILQFDDANDTTTTKYHYDAAGHFLQQKEYDYTTAGGAQLFDQVDYVSNANGNITSETESSPPVVDNYEYSAELNTISMGVKYLPRNKNLVSRTTETANGSTITINHTYTFDSMHRITSERQEYSSGELLVYTYTY